MAEEFNAQALVVKAQSGDADAQYRLAALLMGEQQGDNALTWLRKAAANNHKDARFTLANFYMSGQLVSRDTARAAKMIIQLHEGGYGAASQMLSVMLASGYCVERNWQAALDILLSSAALGRSGALREVALLLILAGEDDALCHQLLMAAATRGDIHSAMIYRTAIYWETNALMLPWRLSGAIVPSRWATLVHQTIVRASPPQRKVTLQT